MKAANPRTPRGEKMQLDPSKMQCKKMQKCKKIQKMQKMQKKKVQLPKKFPYKPLMLHLKKILPRLRRRHENT
jgi:hypothetical protein